MNGEFFELRSIVCMDWNEARKGILLPDNNLLNLVCRIWRILMNNYFKLMVILQFLLLLGCGRNCSDAGKSVLHDYFPETKGLNVLVISFDALRADALGCYGSKLGATPNIDAFAREAVVFSQAHSAAQATPTSFAATFTGKLPFRSFIGWKMVNGQTIASVFKRAGYSTSLIATNGFVNDEKGFAQGFDYFENDTSTGDEEMLPKVLEQIASKKNDKFFAWFHFISPHAPYDYREMAKKFYDPEYNGRFKNRVPSKYTLENGDEIKIVRQLYDGEVYYADYLFEKVIGEIKKNGLEQNTIIILTSDHGEEFLDHGGIEHNNLFEEVIRVPLIIKHPKAVRSGVTDLAYENIDLLPTLAGLLQLEYDKKIDGVDIGMVGHKMRPQLAVAMTNQYKMELSVRVDFNKLIQSCTPEKKEALFNLTTDQKELIDVLKQQRTIAASLDKELKTIVGSEDPCQLITKAVQGISPEENLSKEQIKRLKTLGYLQ